MTTQDRSLRAALRQWRFSPALRIARREVPSDALAVAEATTGADTLDDAALAEVATGLWRARRRMLVAGTDEPSPDFLQPFRHVESTWIALERAGVTIQDHDGARYVPGLALKVLAFEESRDVTAEEVVRTIRPSVYVQGRTVQQGEVIVGTPPDDIEEPVADAPGPEEGHSP